MIGRHSLAADTSGHLPFRMVLASMVGLWMFYFVLTTLRSSIIGLELQEEMLWRRGIVSLAGIGVTFALWMVLRLVDTRAIGWKVAVAIIAALPASILIAQINQMVFSDIEGKVIEKVGEREGVKLRQDEAGNVLIDIPGVQGEIGDPGQDGAEMVTVTLQRAPSGLDRWRQISDIALGRYFLLIAWAALYLALLAGAQARAAERRESAFRDAAKAAELRSLRYQVNPHFLFNTLNSLSSLVMTGKADRAEEMIQAMSSFYRHSLADDTTADVPLADEFALQRHYLEIEQARFPNRLEPVVDLPGDLSDCRVPGMLLQPLVENSVKYAVSPSKRIVRVEISARREADRLVLRVADNGSGKVEIPEHGFGIGLPNVRDRLRARFGDDATLTSGPDGEGFATEIDLPADCA